MLYRASLATPSAVSVARFQCHEFPKDVSNYPWIFWKCPTAAVVSCPAQPRELIIHEGDVKKGGGHNVGLLDLCHDRLWICLPQPTLNYCFKH